MSITRIHDWLASNGPFTEGVLLLHQHGSPTATDLFLFGQRENSVIRKRLRDRLSELVAPHVARSKHRTASLRGKPAPPPANPAWTNAEKYANSAEGRKDITVDMLPPALRQVRIGLKKKHALMNFLRGGLLYLPDGMELKRRALQVVQLHSDMKADWFRLEVWRTTGEVLKDAEPVKPPPLAGKAALLLRRNNLRTYISRHNKGKRLLAAAKLAAYQQELDGINQKLDAEA